MAETEQKPPNGPRPLGGHFEADIGDDVIREALESVKRHAAASGKEIEIQIPSPDAGQADAATTAKLAALQKELDETQATLQISAERAKETLDRLKDAHERQLRAVADLDNYKKRAHREREEAEKFALGKLAKDLLPVLDNLDRALEHSAAEGAAGQAEGALATGVQATRKLFEEILGKYGVKGFSAKGQAFDPNKHEAMQQVATSDVPPGFVAKEIVRGYFLHERLLRPAMVTVATAPKALEPAKPADPPKADESPAAEASKANGAEPPMAPNAKEAE